MLTLSSCKEQSHHVGHFSFKLIAWRKTHNQTQPRRKATCVLSRWTTVMELHVLQHKFAISACIVKQRQPRINKQFPKIAPRSCNPAFQKIEKFIFRSPTFMIINIQVYIHVLCVRSDLHQNTFSYMACTKKDKYWKEK